MTVLADRYDLAEPLGSGGMARVVAAHDRLLHRRVAVKLIRDDLVSDPDSRRRLLQEARAAAALHHPHAVAVFDVGEEAGRPFIVMELVAGQTLADRLGAQGRMAPDEAVELGSALLDALDAAHQRGLVHRDVKPANILLPDAGGVKLADFGIARAGGASVTMTATGQVLGTPRYLAPEQAAGRPATPVSDLYALGVVLFECLAGRPPFTGDNPVAVAVAHQHDPVPALGDLVDDIPPALAAAVEQALAKDPRERFPDAAAMAAALQASATAGPIGASPERSPQPEATAVLPVGGHPQTDSTAAAVEHPRAGWWRHRWGWLAAGVAALALVAVAATLNGAPTDEVAVPPPPGDSAAAPDTAPDTASEPADNPGHPLDADPPEAPEDLGALLSALAGDPEAAGERGMDLLEALLALRAEEPGADQAKRARELLVDISEWVADGELDPDAGGQAGRVLAPLGRPEADELASAYTLFTEVAADRGGWGEKAGDLVEDLADLFEAKPKDWGEDAEDLVEDLEDWIEDGEIDGQRARHAITVLSPLAAQEGGSQNRRERD